MKKLAHLFDFSEYPKNHVLYDGSKANHLFYLKDELGVKAAITHFIGLKRIKLAKRDLIDVDGTKGRPEGPSSPEGRKGAVMAFSPFSVTIPRGRQKFDIKNQLC